MKILECCKATQSLLKMCRIDLETLVSEQFDTNFRKLNFGEVAKFELQEMETISKFIVESDLVNNLVSYEDGFIQLV